MVLMVSMVLMVLMVLMYLKMPLGFRWDFNFAWPSACHWRWGSFHAQCCGTTFAQLRVGQRWSSYNLPATQGIWVISSNGSSGCARSCLRNLGENTPTVIIHFLNHVNFNGIRFSHEINPINPFSWHFPWDFPWFSHENSSPISVSDLLPRCRSARSPKIGPSEPWRFRHNGSDHGERKAAEWHQNLKSMGGWLENPILMIWVNDGQ